MNVGTLIAASNRSPMRRGLKHAQRNFSGELRILRFKPIPDEEGTETYLNDLVAFSSGWLQTDPR